MKFEIKGDKKKIIPIIKKFVEETREEFKIQMEKAKRIPMPFGIGVPDLPFEVGWLEDGDSIVIWNTAPMPERILKSFIGKRIKKKMKKNLEGYLKAKGLEVEVTYIGD